jgi:hypothetical protein
MKCHLCSLLTAHSAAAGFVGVWDDCFERFADILKVCRGRLVVTRLTLPAIRGIRVGARPTPTVHQMSATDTL